MSSTVLSTNSKLPPVLLLGGTANALSIARSLGQKGIKVQALNNPTAHVCFSRYCRWLSVPWQGSDEKSWSAFLLGPASAPYRGAVLLACSDPGIQLLARHRDILGRNFLLDESNPTAQLAMLNKLSTYQQAVAAGVPTPRFWLAKSPEALLELKEQLRFPLLVKPLLSHVFGERFGTKFFVARDFNQLWEGYRTASRAEVEVMLVEMIPGPDDRLCSYYTYLDEQGRPLFHFTKRIIRRFPAHMGEACYHVSDWNPEVKEAALKLFRAAGLRGLANAEFKRDERDGLLKLIECNARFTAANCLLAECGFDLGRFVYNRVVGLPQPRLHHYRRGLRLWYPGRDVLAFRELQKKGEISYLGWLGSLLHPQTLPYFRWSDPLPSLAAALFWARLDVPFRLARRIGHSCARWLGKRLAAAFSRPLLFWKHSVKQRRHDNERSPGDGGDSYLQLRPVLDGCPGQRAGPGLSRPGNHRC